jgi:hypothetical protein
MICLNCHDMEIWRWYMLICLLNAVRLLYHWREIQHGYKHIFLDPTLLYLKKILSSSYNNRYQLVLLWAQLTKIYPPLPTSVQSISIIKTLLIVCLLVKRRGSLSFLTIFTFAVTELLDLIWRKIGFLPYVVW